MSPEVTRDEQRIAAIVKDYKTRANDAKVYLDIMEGRVGRLAFWLKLIKILTVVVPVILALSVDPLNLSAEQQLIWGKVKWWLVAALGVLVGLSLGGDWDLLVADYRAWIELLRVQQLGFQRQGSMVHDNANNIAYTHRIEAEKHDQLMGRIAKNVTLQDFKKRAKELKLDPQNSA